MSVGADLDYYISDQMTMLGPLSAFVTSQGSQIVPTRDNSLAEPIV